MGGNRCVAYQVHYDFLGCTLTLQKYEYILFLSKEIIIDKFASLHLFHIYAVLQSFIYSVANIKRMLL